MKKINLLFSSLIITSLTCFSGCSFLSIHENSVSSSLSHTNSESNSTSTVIEDSSNDELMGKEVRVTYVPNNGLEPKTRPAYCGELLIEPGSFEREFYELDGWYLDEKFEDKWNFKRDIVKGDLTLYAKWEINYDEWIYRLARLSSKSTIMFEVRHYKTESDYNKNRVTSAGFGSGVVIAKERDYDDGNTYFYALTNNHVVSYSEEEGGNYNREEMVDTYKDVISIYDHFYNIYSGELIAKSNKYDLALVRFRNKAIQNGHYGNTTNDAEVGIKVSEFAKEDPQIGLDVAAYGAPLAQPQVCTVGNVTRYTKGTISQKPNGVSYITDFDVIQHTADILGGNSGGPLFGPDLKIVGINYGSVGHNDTYTTSDMFWAIPVTKVKEFVRNRDKYLCDKMFNDRFEFLDEIAKK